MLIGLLSGASLLIDRWLWIIRVAGSSMAPTVRHGDIIVAIKKQRGLTIRRGDLVIVRLSEGSPLIIKRVVGLPGERLDWAPKSVSIQPVTDEQMNFPLTLNHAVTHHASPSQIPIDCYFLVGDNIQQAIDSRVFGPIRAEIIEGTVKLRLWPLSRLGNLNSLWPLQTYTARATAHHHPSGGTKRPR